MDYSNTKASLTTITRDLRQFDEKSGNIYETLAVISKRANLISRDIKEEITNKLQDFSSPSDNLEEIFENREQIEISRRFERMSKPTLLAIQEFLEDQIHYSKPEKEEGNIL